MLHQDGVALASGIVLQDRYRIVSLLGQGGVRVWGVVEE
jgi:hypothetical protein